MVVQETSGDVTLNSQVVEGTALARHSGEEVSRSDVHGAWLLELQNGAT